MSEGNGAGVVVPVTQSPLVVSVSVVYQLRAELEIAQGKLADAERRAQTAEKRVAELLALGLHEPESPLGKRCALELSLREAGLRR